MTTASVDLAPVWTGWTDLVRRRSAAVIVASGIAGIATDLAIRHGPPTLSATLLICVAAVALLVAGRPTNPQSIALTLAVPLFGVWFTLRMSPIILGLDVVAAVALLALGAAFARGGSILDLSLPSAILHALRAVANAALAPAYLLEGSREPGRRAAIVRGVLLAVPLLVIVGALFASADVVFASAMRFDWTQVVFHAVLIALGTWTMAALLRLASVKPARALHIATPSLGRTEWTIVLGSLDALLVGFVAARVAAMTQGGKRVISTAGLTYAQYARSGFFQLLGASVVAFGALLAIRAIAQRSESVERFIVLAAIALGSLLFVVVQAVQRLVLYERAYGLTMLRVLATATCVWVGISLVLLAIWIAGVGANRYWFWTAAGVAALAIVLGLNIVNVEALVARRDMAHAASASHRYVGSDLVGSGDLGDDAVPTLVSGLSVLPDVVKQQVITNACAPDPLTPGNWLSYNRSAHAAKQARDRLCPGRTE